MVPRIGSHRITSAIEEIHVILLAVAFSRMKVYSIP